MAVMYLTAACRAALHEEFARDSSVFLMGEDVVPGMTGRTEGLAAAFGQERVRDTPISEDTFMGIGVGAAAVGMRPIVDLQNSNFIYAAMDQVMNNAAKLRFMMGGSVDFPLTIIATYGGASAAQHSDSLYSQVVNGGGIKVVVPTNPYDAKGLLKSAIRDPDPVLFLIHSWLGAARGEVPDEEYLVPLSTSHVAREGSDVTIVAIGLMLTRALEAAEALAAEGISAEVVDPRTLFPLDFATIRSSVAKTGRLVVVDEARRSCSVASEIVARVSTDAFDLLKRPPVILANPDMHIPHNRSLLDAIIPQTPNIIDAVRALVPGLGRWVTVPREFRLPNLGMQIEEGFIAQWLVGVGDSIAEGQDIVEVETDKAQTALPSPFAGTVVRILAESGQAVRVGGLLAEIEPSPSGSSSATSPQ